MGVMKGSRFEFQYGQENRKKTFTHKKGYFDMLFQLFFFTCLTLIYED